MKKLILSISVAFLLMAGAKAQLNVLLFNPNPCFGSCVASAQINPTGNYKYHCSTNEPAARINTLCAGVYWCTITDSVGGFLDSVSANISQPAPITMNGSVTN